ncbi:MFS transporter [Siphonobacter aquaeclarae]|uniref:Sugar phosphate permease n=1 Tax=Siphonobacter aquaeclarae TaxID=563176 RepID=A0A1G9N7T7_9BACT|nr:MFS transporter [Siphonobacter aquaeclarae]SDL82596.1 Sugar phosphate permease [Siphonobacter aquaeclarae]
MSQTSTLSSSSVTMREYPWVIAVSGLMILITVNGLTTSSLSVFDEVIQQEFGLSRGLLKSRETVTYAVSAAFILLSGVLIDRFGVKKLLLTGLGFMTLALAGYGYARNLTHLYLLHVLLGLAYVSAGSVSVVILVSAWFREKRGLALGVTLAGTSLGSAVFPPLLTYLIRTEGWRSAFHWLAVIPVVLAVYTALVVRDSPGTVGARITDATEHPIQEGMEYSVALKTRLFWIISFCGFLSFLGIVGLVSNLFLHFRSTGFLPAEAAWVLTLYFSMALLGKFTVSSLSDYVCIYRMFSLCFAGLAAGALGVAWLSGGPAVAAVGVAAFSWGGVFTLYTILIVRTFGLKAAGKINGTIHLFENIGSLLGPVLVGLLSDVGGSYRTALLLVAVVFSVALILSFFFERWKPANSAG